MTRRIPSLGREVAGLQRAFKRQDVGAVVVPFDAPERPRLLAKVAKTCGIPSVLVQHGLPVSAALDGDKETCDYALVWSGVVQRQLAEWGVDAGRMRVVGNPMFDRYAEPRAPRSARIGPQTVLVLGASYTNLNVIKDSTIAYRHLRLALDGVRALRSRARVILRPHPSENPDYYRDLLGQWREQVDEIASDRSFEGCLAAADVVITPTSTGALEAFLLGIPVIVIKDCLWGVDYPLDGGAEIPAVTDAAALAVALERSLNQGGGVPATLASPSSRVQAYCGLLEGHSADRVAEFVDQLTELRARPRAAAAGEARAPSD